MLQTYTRLMSFIVTMRREDDGVTAIEYGLIASLIAVAIVIAVALVGTKLTGTFNTIAGKL